MIRIYPYKKASRTYRALKARLRDERGDLVINWGNSDRSLDHNFPNIINKAVHVRKAIDKLTTLRTLKSEGVKCVPFTTDPRNTTEWKRTVCRTQLRASQGRGIVIVERGDRIPNAPLYTKYLGDHREEYRVHVMNGRVIDYSKRVPDEDSDETEIRIRGNQHGWILARNVDRSKSICNLAVEAIEALGLDFGAVDIVKTRKGEDYVLEVNSAPALNEDGIEIYAKAFLKLR